MSKHRGQLVESRSGCSPCPFAAASIKAFSSNVRTTETPGTPTGVRENRLRDPLPNIEMDQTEVRKSGGNFQFRAERTRPSRIPPSSVKWITHQSSWNDGARRGKRSDAPLTAA